MTFLFEPPQNIKYWSRVAVAPVLLLLLLTPFAVQAQADPDGPRRDRTKPLTDGERNRVLENDLSTRETNLRLLDAGRVENAQPPPSPAVKLRMLIAELHKGSDQLQLNNGKLQDAMKTTSVPDYKRIAGYAAEIRKAAQRLQTSLAIPKAEQQEPKPEEGTGPPTEQLRTSTQALDRLVKQFVANEVLQRPGAVDAELFTAAGSDLREMLRHTTGVKKLAEELRVK